MERYRTERRYAANVEEIMAREEARARMAQRRARQGKPAPADEEPTAAQAELWAHINARFQALADAAEKLAMSLDVLDGRPLTVNEARPQSAGFSGGRAGGGGRPADGGRGGFKTRKRDW